MKAITIVFYSLVLIILSTGLYLYAINNRYIYQLNGHTRVDNFTGKSEIYDIIDTAEAYQFKLSDSQMQTFKQLIDDSYGSQGYAITQVNIDSVYNIYKRHPAQFLRDFCKEFNISDNDWKIKKLQDKYPLQ